MEAFQTAAVNAIDAFLAEAAVDIKTALEEYAVTSAALHSGDPPEFAGLEMPKPDVELQALVSSRAAFEAVYEEKKQAAQRLVSAKRHRMTNTGAAVAIGTVVLGVAAGVAAAPLLALAGFGAFAIEGLMLGRQELKRRGKAIDTEREQQLAERDPRYDFPFSLSDMQAATLAAAKSAAEAWQTKATKLCPERTAEAMSSFEASYTNFIRY